MTDKFRAVSFSGAGTLGVYHLGAIHALFSRGKHVLESIRKFGGASAGSIAATILAVCPDRAKEWSARFDSLVDTMSSHCLGGFTPGLEVAELLKAELLEFLPADAHQLASGRLFISITHARTNRNVVVSQFSSVEELVQCIACSCCIPGYSAPLCRPLTYSDGERYTDGAMSNHLPVFGDSEPTILVSPYIGGGHISPRDSDRGGSGGPSDRRRMYITFSGMDVRVCLVNLFYFFQGLSTLSPKKRRLYELAGQRDALRFLRELAQRRLLLQPLPPRFTPALSDLVDEQDHGS